MSPPAVERALGRRDRAVSALDSALESLIDAVEDRLDAALRGAPYPDATPFELRIAAAAETGDPDAIRAAASAATLAEVEALIELAGGDDARTAWFGSYGAIVDAVQAEVTDVGLEWPDAAMGDSVDALAQRHNDVFWQGVERNLAGRVLDAIVTGAGIVAAARLVEAAGESMASATAGILTEAAARVAEVEGVLKGDAAAMAGAAGGGLLWAYAGPNDRITRDFCRELEGKAFTRAQVQRLDNGQTATHPMQSRGGYNCRHVWLLVRPDALDDLGYGLGEDGDIARANSSAVRRRKGKRRRGGARA